MAPPLDVQSRLLMMSERKESNEPRGLDGDNSKKGDADASSSPGVQPTEEGGKAPEPIGLEPIEPGETDRPAPRAPSSVTADSEEFTCSECGAALDPSEDICLRCGQRANPAVADSVAEAESKSTDKKKADEAKEEPAGPIVMPTRSPTIDLWLPVGLAALAVVILVIGHLAGWIGLFPQVRVREDVVAAPWGMRFSELLRTLILLVFWTGCGLAGLFALSVMLERQFGDARLAALRMAAIMATIRLSTIITSPGPRWIEWMTETMIQAGAFILLAMLLFRLAIRNAAILAGWTLLAIFTLWMFTFAVQWALSAT